MRCGRKSSNSGRSTGFGIDLPVEALRFAAAMTLKWVLAAEYRSQLGGIDIAAGDYTDNIAAARPPRSCCSQRGSARSLGNDMVALCQYANRSGDLRKGHTGGGVRNHL